MTYQELCSFDTLWTAYHRARRCKRGKKSTAPFEYSAIEELLILSKSLLQGTHQPDPLDAFYIYEPKKRLIQAPTFRDKVVQHALTDYIVYDELARSFTLNTYAAQYGKGTHYGLEMLKRHMRTYFLRRKGADEAARKAAGLPHRPMELRRGLGHQGRHPPLLPEHRPPAAQGRAGTPVSRPGHPGADVAIHRRRGRGPGPGTPDEPHLRGVLRQLLHALCG